MYLKRNPYLFPFIFFLSFQPVLAGDFAGQYVCALQMDLTGRAVLRPCETWLSKNNCPGRNGWVEWYENENQGGGKGMHAIALSAMMSNKPVMLRIAGDCSGQWDHLAAIRIYK